MTPLRIDSPCLDAPPGPAWPGARWLPALVVALLVGLPIYFVARGPISEWNDCFYTAARHFLLREPIHAQGETYAYPPSMAALSAAWCVGSLESSLAVWGLINAVATIVTIVLGWRLAGGEAWRSLDARSARVWLLGLFLAAPWIVIPLAHQQYDMVITALLYAGLWQLWLGRETRGGLLLGLAASMKCTPLLFAPYLLWRGRWRGAAAMTIMAIALNVGPDLLWPQASGGSYLADWDRLFLRGVVTAAPGSWHSDLVLNQSLGGLLQRLARAVVGLDATLSPETIRALKWLTYGGGLALALGVALRAGALGRRYALRDEAPPALAPPLAVEASAVLCLMLLLSPMSSKAHYVVLLLPILIVTRVASARPTRFNRLGLGAMLALSWLTRKGLIGKTLGEALLFFGAPTWLVLGLLAAMFGLLGRRVELPPSDATHRSARAGGIFAARVSSTRASE